MCVILSSDGGPQVKNNMYLNNVRNLCGFLLLYLGAGKQHTQDFPHNYQGQSVGIKLKIQASIWASAAKELLAHMNILVVIKNWASVNVKSYSLLNTGGWISRLFRFLTKSCLKCNYLSRPWRAAFKVQTILWFARRVGSLIWSCCWQLLLRFSGDTGDLIKQVFKHHPIQNGSL